MVTLTDEQFDALKKMAHAGISHARDMIYEGSFTGRAQDRLWDRIEAAREALAILADFQAGRNEPVENETPQKTAEEIADEVVARYSHLTVDDLGLSADEIAAAAIIADRAQRDEGQNHERHQAPDAWKRSE